MLDIRACLQGRQNPRGMPPREFGLNFTVVSRDVCRGAHTFFWPTLIFHWEDGQGGTSTAECEPLNGYFEDNTRFGHQWRRTTATGFGLFVDYATSRISTMSADERDADDETLERTLLRGFAHALKYGTVPRDPKTADPLGLRWTAKGDNRAGVYLTYTENFLQWVARRNETLRWKWLSTEDARPEHPANAMRVAAELSIRSKKSLLSHIRGTERSAPPSGHSQKGVIGPRKTSTEAVYSFPEQYVAPFLFEAFDLENESQRTAATIAAVLMGGGLRSSEPLHAFVSDVQFANDQAVFALHHPQFAEITDQNGDRMTREAYLANLGMRPRNRDFGGPDFAGWKGLADDYPGTQVYWLPIPSLRARVEELLRHYIRVTRPAIMGRRPRSAIKHPYLFVSSGLGRGERWGEPGDPYSLSALRSEWQAGILRLARKYDDPELKFIKKLGTTLHGPRHFYGRFLKTLGVDGEIIMRCMHHKDFESHLVYGRLTPLEIDTLLQRAGEAPIAKQVTARNFEQEIENHMKTAA